MREQQLWIQYPSFSLTIEMCYNFMSPIFIGLLLLLCQFCNPFLHTSLLLIHVYLATMLSLISPPVNNDDDLHLKWELLRAHTGHIFTYTTHGTSHMCTYVYIDMTMKGGDSPDNTELQPSAQSEQSQIAASRAKRTV